MKNTLEFLAYRGPDHLTEQFGIKVRAHPQHPNLLHLCYDQIASAPHNGHPIVRECRGLIVDFPAGRVVAYPFQRFYNDGESHADPIDWASARVQQKLDGSLLVLWSYAGAWHVSTKGSPDAGGNVGEHALTFRDLFWQTFHAQGFDLAQLDPAWTYMFELTSPLNRVVVSYTEHRLFLIGAREVTTGVEAPVSAFPHLCPVQEVSLASLDDVRAAAAAMYPLDEEGLVVVDRHFCRVKVKSPKYVALHHMKDQFGVRRMLELIKAGESSELLAYFPEYREQFNDTAARFDALVADLEADYTRLAHIESQKDFALEAVKTRWSAALFKVRRGQAPTIRAALADVPVDRLERLLSADPEVIGIPGPGSHGGSDA